MYKTCNICEIEKEASLFAIEKNSSDGLRSSCRECIKEYNKKYYKEHREKIIAQKISYQKTLPKEKKRQYDRNWSERNPEKRKEYEKKRKQTKSFKDWRKKYERHKKETNPAYKLRNLLSVKIRTALKKNSNFKESSYLKFLEYSCEDLVKHLEAQFTPEMNWKNHGTYWHIDHIVPQILLPFVSLEEENFKKCWALENLRPLEKKENLKKGKKTIEEYNEWKRTSKQSGK